MCTTEFITERAQEFERVAQGKIEVLDYLILHIGRGARQAEELSRAAGLLALITGMHAALVQEKAAAHRVIEEANALRLQAKDLA